MPFQAIEGGDPMNGRRILGIGIVGFVITAICCFTPVLAIGLGVIGLAAWLAWLDYVLIPALVAFLGLIAYGLISRQRIEKERC